MVGTGAWAGNLQLKVLVDDTALISSDFSLLGLDERRIIVLVQVVQRGVLVRGRCCFFLRWYIEPILGFPK